MSHFGTDGIRGQYGTEPLVPATIRQIAAATGKVLLDWKPQSRGKIAPRVLIGRDTRESGPAILAALADGFASVGLAVFDLGVLPTPGVAYAVRSVGASAGVVVSASHNPWQDNGIKFFGPDGFKLPDQLEAEIGVELGQCGKIEPGIGAVENLANSEDMYLSHIVAAGCEGVAGDSVNDQPLAGRRIVVDCSNGAASQIAPEAFRRLGAEVIAIHAEPNGKNINLNCGALYPEVVSAAVLEHKADAGVTLDGDADRVMLADRRGRVADGDVLLVLLARALAGSRELPGSSVVTTVMANYGLELALEALGLKVIRTPVGDRHVVAEMLRSGCILGGEQSGHIIHLTRGSTTGDGLLTAVTALTHAFAQAQDLLEAEVERYRPMPQILLNVKVREKPPLLGLEPVARAVRGAEEALAGKGRVVLRYSGTETLARVMVEGEPAGLIQESAELIADAIRSQIGAG